MIDPEDHVTQPLAIPAPMALRMETSTRTLQAELLQDLLGNWMVIQNWIGKQGARNGRKVTVVDTHDAGLALLHHLKKRHQPSEIPEICGCAPRRPLFALSRFPFRVLLHAGLKLITARSNNYLQSLFRLHHLQA